METARARRLRTIPLLTAVFALSIALLPIIVPLALVVDGSRWFVRRTPFMAVRIVAFGVVYAGLELLGLAALGSVWILSGFGASRARLLAGTFSIQVWWANAVLVAVERIFGLDIHAEGVDQVEATPYVLVARHASIVDNLLPARFISRPHRIHLSYVMKAELLADPCLDVAGNRLPNVFVRRGSGEADAEVAAIRRLGETADDRSAVLIYPEGTRFSSKKLAAAVKRLSNRSPGLHEIAKGFRSVLPPRPAGTLALIDAMAADVVVMAHRGLDGFARVADIWRGAMVRQRVDVSFWRIPAADIPADRASRVDWLYRTWAEIDGWIADHSAEAMT